MVRAGWKVATSPRSVFYVILNAMNDQPLNDNTKRRGRPATGKGELIGVRLQPEILEWIDLERGKINPPLSRPEMVRRILERCKSK